MSQALVEAPALAPSDSPPPPRSPLRSLTSRDPRLLGAIALVAASMIGLLIALYVGVVGVAAVPSVLRTAVVGIALFALCGYPAAQILARGELRAHRPLLVLPLGAAVSAIVLGVLGLLHVPLKVSLAVLIGVSALASLRAYRTGRGAAPATDEARPSSSERSLFVRVLLPLGLAGMVGLISLVPIFRLGFATVPGQNGDAVLVVGSAVLLEHAPPTATRTNLPINHIPLEWRSKYPIYYPLAATATIAGQDPIQAFATISALILAFTSVGFFLFARYALRAPPAVALLAMFLVPLDRIVMYVTIHPYYNELWGQFTLPFMLLAGWRLVTEPDRRTALLLVCFAVLGLLAYPLMVPFPLFFLLAAWWVRRRQGGAGEPRGRSWSMRLAPLRRSAWIWALGAVVMVPVVVVLVRGFFEKTLSAVAVLFPWTSLSGWTGTSLSWLPWPRFVGMPGSGWPDYIGLAIVCLLAARGFTRIRSPEARWGMVAMVLATALIGIYFRLRPGGQLFFFKDLAFLGPYVLLLALLELGALARSAARNRLALGIGGLALALFTVPASAAAEINLTYDNATVSILALRSWDHALPRGTSVRIDVPPSGYQLWTTYMFSDHPLSALNPLGGFFPHPRQGRKADYVIAETNQPRPSDAIGAPLLENKQFVLWRMNPAVPGPDVSSRHLVDDVSQITLP